MGQLVLVCESQLLNQIGQFQGYSLHVGPYLSTLLDPENNRFMERDVAEQDQNFKQLIPYVVLRYRDSIFTYVRGKGSSETRLIAQRSIGLGGHIEPHDRSLFASDHDLYLQAAKREVDEEVEIHTSWTEQVVAVLNDDSTDVGKVHFGIVHIWDMAEPHVKKREGLITQSGFMPIAVVEEDAHQLETWSQFTLQVLKDPAVPAYGEHTQDVSNGAWKDRTLKQGLGNL